jgi:mannose-6-phosphate isomerase-like protein (cupin superfamily)
MTRQNLFSHLWDGETEQPGTRRRVFWRPDDARMGATLYDLAPGAPESRMHMHYGAEEMFFVLSGRPQFRNQHGEEALAPGDFVFCLEGRAGLHTFSNPTDGPVGSSRSVPGASPTWSPTPNTDTRGSPLAIPIPTYSRREAIPGSSPGSRSRWSRPADRKQTLFPTPRRLRRRRGRQG